MARTSAPSRARVGATTGTPCRRSGAAVTGPTQAASTSERSASSTRVAARPGGAQQRADGRRRGERDRVDQPAGHEVDQPVQRRRVGRRRPPVDRHLDHGRRRRPRSASVHSGCRSPCSCIATTCPATPRWQQVVEHLLAALRRRRPLVVQAGGPDRAARLGAAGHQVGAGQHRRAAARPAPSPRPPPASRACRCRCWPPRRRAACRGRRRVAARSSVSSASGTMRSAGASTTRAPRRSSSAASSSRRRSAVTPTVKPASSLIVRLRAALVGPTADLDHAVAAAAPGRWRTATPGHVEALAGAQVVDLLVQRRGDGRARRRGCRRCRATCTLAPANGSRLSMANSSPSWVRKIATWTPSTSAATPRSGSSRSYGQITVQRHGQQLDCHRRTPMVVGRPSATGRARPRPGPAGPARPRT